MKKKLFFTLPALALLCFVSYSFWLQPEVANVSADDDKLMEIEWISMEEAEKRSQKDDKKIIVDVYTNWCGWCKKLDKETYGNAEVIKYIKKNYHAVHFNAEQKADVVLGGKTFKYRPGGRNGVHELAVEMLKGRMSYPNTVFFDGDLNIITAMPGYRGPAEMLGFLNYFAQDVYKTNPNAQAYVNAFVKKSK